MPNGSEAYEQRVRVVSLNEESFTGIFTRIKDGSVLAVLFDAQNETVLKFFLSVDSAFDIIDHLLTDPFDAMAVIDAKARVVFVSPIHEKFFGLRPGRPWGETFAK